MTTTTLLDSLHHVAIEVREIARAVEWYRESFACELLYQDETWALLGFRNVKLALVLPEQHPRHIAVARPDAARFGELVPHRDGTRSVYVQDADGNAVEVLDAASVARAEGD